MSEALSGDVKCLVRVDPQQEVVERRLIYIIL